jgi:hypothetical protein
LACIEAHRKGDVAERTLCRLQAIQHRSQLPHRRSRTSDSAEARANVSSPRFVGAWPSGAAGYALEVFDMRTAYPLVFALNAATSDEHVREAVYRLIESYVVRRAICGLTPKNYNTIFLRLATIARESWPSEAVLASLFRDLGVADLDATPGPAAMADRAPAQHEARVNAATPATPESELDRRHSMAFVDLEPKIRDLTHMAELARFHAIDTFGSNSPAETEEGKRERSIALFAVVHVEEMVRDLEKVYDAGWSRAPFQRRSAARHSLGDRRMKRAAFGPPFFVRDEPRGLRDCADSRLSRLVRLGEEDEVFLDHTPRELRDIGLVEIIGGLKIDFLDVQEFPVSFDFVADVIAIELGPSLQSAELLHRRLARIVKVLHEIRIARRRSRA